MQETQPLPGDTLPAAAGARAGRFIYIAAPFTPLGGGMYKVTDYLVQSQSGQRSEDAAELRPLDSRGPRSAAWSMWVLLTALAKILWGRLGGRLAGVHVNVAERLSFVRKGTIIAWAHALGLPVVLHLHAQMQRFYRRLPAPLRALARWVFSLADVVVVIGPAARRFVTEELKVPADRVEIVINGVPAATQARRTKPVDGVQRVMFLGNLGRLKGVDDLLQALARPGFDRERLEVTIAGGGDVEGYRAQARQLCIADFVRLPGWCDQAQTAALLANTDVLILPSYDEVLPLVILEALANGVAVICTEVGEVPSLLTDGVDTLYVKPGDVDGIAAALRQVLGDAHLRETLEHNGHALYQRQFSLPRFFEAVARVHQRAFGVAARHRDAPAVEPQP
ncbi:glycosyltransferase family 4 protein [Ramlibacter sp. RBP-2]|uniref:Glycosyltransferase family 4 protein n=1 Tax=Ramlibacter lithotrophicus TaxID=2606681 RepID=A0A7X6DKZ9_9BURK|nr:glycosyltransferase family 4 protein [Ramlibacter lithotrophicus]NKE69110.1 glycosyltransferase family 4 protein [Ramlibacter lithotrophicus]